MLLVGGGTGLLYLLGWFWLRITAWCVIAAMFSSFAISAVFLVLQRSGAMEFSTQGKLVLTVAFTTVCWVATAYLGPQTAQRVLIDFYLKVRPAGPGWRHIRAAAELQAGRPAGSPDNIPLALLGWSLGCALIWSALFAVGNYCYGRTGPALALAAIAAICGYGVARILRTLWQRRPGKGPADDSAQGGTGRGNVATAS
jgi:phosphatidylglycerophosphate synthase